MIHLHMQHSLTVTPKSYPKSRILQVPSDPFPPELHRYLYATPDTQETFHDGTTSAAQGFEMYTVTLPTMGTNGPQSTRQTEITAPRSTNEHSQSPSARGQQCFICLLFATVVSAPTSGCSPWSLLFVLCQFMWLLRVSSHAKKKR